MNDHPEDEDQYTSEIIVLKGKELRIVKYTLIPSPSTSTSSRV